MAGSRILARVLPPTATEVADQLYARWNEAGLAVLTDAVDPDIELVCDPLCPDDSTLRGIEGWKQWVARWDEGYESMHITIDGLIPLSAEHVLAVRGLRDVSFVRPIRIGDTIRVRCRLRELRAVDDALGLVDTGWEVVNQSDELAVRAVVELLWRRS